MNSEAYQKTDQLISFQEFLEAFALLRVDQSCVLEKEARLGNRLRRELVVELGFLSDDEVVKALKKFGSFDEVTFKDIQVGYLVPLPLDIMYSAKMLACRQGGDKGSLFIACLDPYDVRSLDQIKMHLGHNGPISLKVIGLNELNQALEWSGKQQISTSFAEETPDLKWGTDKVFKPRGDHKTGVADVVEELLRQAIGARATDLHFNVKERHVNVRMRCFGVLQEIKVLHKDIWPEMLSYLKVKAGMNISEHKLPQVGRISYNYSGRTVDLRCSTHPTYHGENFVIRILDRLASVKTLDHLGFTRDQVDLLRNEIKKTQGLIVIAGGTGTGKTTTLYALLTELAKSELNIMTLEDPIEYEFAKIEQTQVHPKIGFDYAQGVRSILRQDPDVILIGEIRDEETARMALRASMTGHLVLTTLHTNGALSIPQRFQDLGVPSALLSGNLNCLMAQRLVSSWSSSYRDQVSLNAVAEIISVDPELDLLISTSAPTAALKEYGRKLGLTLLEDLKEASGGIALENSALKSER